jgi:hypothetical protein
MIEVLKQALEALEECRRDPRLKYEHPTFDKAIPSLRQAIAELENQEPVATVTSETGNPDITMSWWHEPALPMGTKLFTHPPQRTEERNFCPRCGKRTADLTVIHTCTPPMEKNNEA